MSIHVFHAWISIALKSVGSKFSRIHSSFPYAHFRDVTNAVFLNLRMLEVTRSFKPLCLFLASPSLQFVTPPQGRQGGWVVRAPDLKSLSRGFRSCSDRWLMFNFSATLVNSKLVCLSPVGIHNLLSLFWIFIYHCLLTLVLKSPNGEWPITYTYLHTCKRVLHPHLKPGDFFCTTRGFFVPFASPLFSPFLERFSFWRPSNVHGQIWRITGGPDVEYD